MVPAEYRIPASFQEGAKYYLMEKKEDGTCVYSAVIFLSYSSAPVFVYVNSSGRTLYVPREDLFERIASL